MDKGVQAVRGGVIYVVTNKVNGHQYVGLTIKTVAHRWAEHKRSAMRGVNTYFYSALRKYRAAAFDVQEYASVMEKGDLAFVESYVIKQLHPAYNQTNGGEVTLGRKYDDATKERIRQSNTGKKRTPEQSAANGVRFKTHWENDPIFREKILAGLKKASAAIDREKQRAAASVASKNRKWTESSRAKLSASCMGRRYGADVIDRMAAAKRKAVRCNETGEVFLCREEAAKKTGVSCRTIFRDVCGENRKPAKGRITFSYV